MKTKPGLPPLWARGISCVRKSNHMPSGHYAEIVQTTTTTWHKGK